MGKTGKIKGRLKLEIWVVCVALIALPLLAYWYFSHEDTTQQELRAVKRNVKQLEQLLSFEGEFNLKAASEEAKRFTEVCSPELKISLRREAGVRKLANGLNHLQKGYVYLRREFFQLATKFSEINVEIDDQIARATFEARVIGQAHGRDDYFQESAKIALTLRRLERGWMIDSAVNETAIASFKN